VIRRQHRSAFTLVELLMVLSVLVLLLAMLVPSVQGIREQTLTGVCREQMGRLAGTLHISVAKTRRLPSASEWAGYVAEAGAPDLLKCPKDVRKIDTGKIGSGGSGLDAVFIRHDHCDGGTYYIPLDEALVKDLSAMAHNTMQVATVSENVREVYMDGMGSFLIEFGKKIRITIGTQKLSPGGGSGSDQYIYQGSKQIMQLRGKSYKAKDPYVPDPKDSKEIPWAAVTVSYGMNGLAPSDSLPRLDQLLLVEYATSIADLDPKGNYIQIFEDNLARRHNNRANVAMTGGSVTSMSLQELDPETPDVFRRLWQP
jgi:prepilin-type processing-associated H-X9-DG protein